MRAADQLEAACGDVGDDGVRDSVPVTRSVTIAGCYGHLGVQNIEAATYSAVERASPPVQKKKGACACTFARLRGALGTFGHAWHAREQISQHAALRARSCAKRALPAHSIPALHEFAVWSLTLCRV